METIIETCNLYKTIDSRDIIAGVNIHVKKGEIYGFLGPNGAGKTTIMKMIANLWKPSAGTIKIFGETLTPKSYSVLKRMSSIIEFPKFYDELSGRENLELHLRYMEYNGSCNITESLQLLDLPTNKKQQVSSYSLGMKQRLGIARALLTKPELLLLDEPTNGLDPAGIQQMRCLIQMLRNEYGITILVSSHLLTEIEHIADRVGILQNGQLMKEAAIQETVGLHLDCMEVTSANALHAAAVLYGLADKQDIEILDEKRIRINHPGIQMKAVLDRLTNADIEVDAISKKTDTLEDYFLKTTKEAI